MKVVLHRSITPGSYWVGDVPLSVHRTGGHWTMSVPRVLYSEDWSSWTQRNQDLLQARYATLRELRHTLEAALDVDPLTDDYEMLPARCLQPDSSMGGYRLQLDDGSMFRIRRAGTGAGSGWTAEARTKDGHWMACPIWFRSLWHVRASETQLSNVGRLARHRNGGST